MCDKVDEAARSFLGSAIALEEDLGALLRGNRRSGTRSGEYGSAVSTETR